MLALTEDEIAAATAAPGERRVLEPVGPNHGGSARLPARWPPNRRRRVSAAPRTGGSRMCRESTGGQPDWRELALHYGCADVVRQAATACQRRRRMRVDVGVARGAHLPHGRSVTRSTTGRSRATAARSPRACSAAFYLRGRGHSVRRGADSPRCLELTGGVPNRETIVTMTALTPHHGTRCDLRRADQLLQSVRSVTTNTRHWLRTVNGLPSLSCRGSVAFDTARENSKRAPRRTAR